MSKYLAPIHSMMYNKILLQEDLTDALLELASEETAADIRARFGDADRRPLEDVIDRTNIHGWIQGRIAASENRFAATVSEILEKGEQPLERLEEEARDFGAARHFDISDTPRDAVVKWQSTFLDGMPCDRVLELAENTDEHVTINVLEDVHAPFWQAMGADPACYRTLRRAWMSGTLEGSNLKVEFGDGSYTVRFKTLEER
jgi:hypothetical protein